MDNTADKDYDEFLTFVHEESVITDDYSSPRRPIANCFCCASSRFDIIIFVWGRRTIIICYHTLFMNPHRNIDHT